MKRRKYPLPLWLLALWPLVLVAMYYHLSLRWGSGETGRQCLAVAPGGPGADAGPAAPAWPGQAPQPP